MKNLIKNILFSLLIYTLSSNFVFSREIVAVISDNLMPVSTNYMIYPESSNLISQEVANSLNIKGRIKALPVCNSINNSKKANISKEIQKFAQEYKYTYNINYEVLRRISDKLECTHILLISSGIDIESQFLRQTGWNRIPIGGENCVSPRYRIITQVSLIDPQNELILMSKNYDMSIKSKDFDLALPSFSPSYALQSKVQKFSYKIASQISDSVEHNLVPDLVGPEPTKIQAVKNTVHNYAKDIGIPLNDKKSTSIQIKTNENENTPPNLEITPKVKLYNYSDLDL